MYKTKTGKTARTNKLIYFNTLSEIDPADRKKKSRKYIIELNKHHYNQLYIMDIYTVLHPTTAEFVFF
jgi:hypothetical protein